MDITSFLFSFFFILIVGLTSYKFYNLINYKTNLNKKDSKVRTTDFGYTITTFFMALIIWLVLFVITLFAVVNVEEELLYVFLFQISNFFISINVIFFIIELILNFNNFKK